MRYAGFHVAINAQRDFDAVITRVTAAAALTPRGGHFATRCVVSIPDFLPRLPLEWPPSSSLRRVAESVALTFPLSNRPDGFHRPYDMVSGQPKNAKWCLRLTPAARSRVLRLRDIRKGHVLPSARRSAENPPTCSVRITR
jgi:hypothetical protein